MFGVGREVEGEDLGDEGPGVQHLAGVGRDPDLKSRRISEDIIYKYNSQGWGAGAAFFCIFGAGAAPKKTQQPEPQKLCGSWKIVIFCNFCNFL